MVTKSCWTCQYHNNATDPADVLLFGVCGWFADHGKEAKEIPAAVADVGCKYWVEKEPAKQLNLF